MFATWSFSFLSLFFFSILFVYFSFVLPSFYSDLRLLGTHKAIYSFFKFSMNELNEVSRILALLIFPTEVFGHLVGILIVFLEFIKFPLIILLETEHTKQFGSIKILISFPALITIYFKDSE